jgi:hypothetical protein
VLGVISREGGLLSGDMIERGMFRCCEVENHQWIITGEKFWEWIVDMKKKCSSRRRWTVVVLESRGAFLLEHVKAETRMNLWRAFVIRLSANTKAKRFRKELIHFSVL